MTPNSENKVRKILELVGGLAEPAIKLKQRLLVMNDEQVHEALLEAIRMCARTDRLR